MAVMLPDRTSQLFSLACEGLDRARSLGHFLDEWIRDDQRTLSAQCLRCDLWLVLSTDPEEEMPMDGTCSILPCSGWPGSTPYWAMDGLQHV